MIRWIARAAAVGMLALTIGGPHYREQPPTSSVAASSGARRVLLGHSVEDRPIRAVALGDRDAHRKVLVVGCIHGNEGAGTAIIRALKKMSLPDGLDLWLVRSINPDGRSAGTRQNGRGVDLNRNFGRKWKPIGNRWDTYYPGPRKFSEPESRIAHDLIIDVRPDITIWYHQHMSLVDASGGKRWIQRRYAELVGLPLRDLKLLPGTATRWQNHRFEDDTSFVVELPAGSLSRKAVRRHARAVLEVTRPKS